jgi:hypoxia up-regulated 1
MWRITWLWLAPFLLGCCYHQAEARAILGIDLGSVYMKVALVQSGSPLEIVTNMHSKRKTEQMILFDGKDQQRFYGADADALLARKASSTPTSMSVMLGRDEQHPAVKVRFLEVE